MDIKVEHKTVVVFDLDDTLYNELDYLKSAYREIAIFLHPSDWKALYYRMFSLYRCNVNVFEFLSKLHQTDVDLLIKMYRSHHPDIMPFDGVVDVFEGIKNKEGKIGIVTDGRRSTQMSKIKSLGIAHYIDKLVISEDIGSEKPNIANFEAIENALLGTDYYYIADNLKKDFIAPNILGWKSVALIDNGKNIHFDCHNYFNSHGMPKEFIINFKDLNII